MYLLLLKSINHIFTFIGTLVCRLYVVKIVVSTFTIYFVGSQIAAQTQKE